MIPFALSPLANHLWQSTLFACLAMLLTLALRKNRAQMRYWIWLAASIKFLAPFSLLVSIGNRFEWRTASAVAPPIAPAIDQLTHPFTLPVTMTTSATAPAFPWMLLLAAVWFCGSAIVLRRWFVRWRRIRIAVRSASALAIRAPIPVMSSPTRLEPGVCGIFRPVLLLPEGIADRLTPAQFAAILAHELSHVRRRDNLVAAIHMLVEALFWFHPLVWWIGARMVEERERACDEEVLRLGSDPEVYADGILKVCRLYLESGLACAAGVTGADLKKRIEAIMTNRIVAGTSFARKLLLAVAGIAAVVVPIGIGVLNAPRIRAQSQTSTGLKFEVASIKPADPNSRTIGFNRNPGNGLKAMSMTLKGLISFAYDVPEFQVSGGSGWMGSERYDILAKPDRPEGPDSILDLPEVQQKSLFAHLRERTRALLADRFQLAVHIDQKEVSRYVLTVGKNGHKLQAKKESDPQTGLHVDRGEIEGGGATMEMVARMLSGMLRTPVLDETGLPGRFNFKVNWSPDTEGKAQPMDKLTAPHPDGSEILTAIQAQLGLKLESKKGPVDIVVIDRAEKPSAN